MARGIKTYRDLEIYQSLYRAMLIVLTKLAPDLPSVEKFGLGYQLRRCCQACPAIIAEGFAKRYQPKHWHKYLLDAVGECNEMIHHLSVCQDAYSDYVDTEIYRELTRIYDENTARILTLRKNWKNFHAK
jgi:four helix bundle protein